MFHSTVKLRPPLPVDRRPSITRLSHFPINDGAAKTTSGAAAPVGDSNTAVVFVANRVDGPYLDSI